MRHPWQFVINIHLDYPNIFCVNFYFFIERLIFRLSSMTWIRRFQSFTFKVFIGFVCFRFYCGKRVPTIIIQIENVTVNIWKRPSNAKNRGWTQVLRKGWQIMLHWWHMSCYSGYKLDDKSRMSFLLTLCLRVCL